MATFNQYSLYSFAAGDFSTSCNDKILVDLHRLESMKMYNEIVDYIHKTFGEFEDKKHLEYPNDIEVDLIKNEKMILVYASQKGEKIFGTCWEPADKE
jgi:hypothetical protein